MRPPRGRGAPSTTWCAVRALPAEYREPLILKVLHGWSQQEIAERLSLTSAGVGTRLFRARQKLREALGAVA